MKTSKTQLTIVLFFIHIFLFTFFPSNVSSDTSTSKAANALLTWKASLSPSSSLKSWSPNNIKNLCTSWAGISCHNGLYVSQLNLTNENLTGTLNKLDFTSFPELTTLNLNGNNLNGSIPARIGSLSKLTFLDLSNNLFENSIPPEIGHLKIIKYINFYNNNLKNKMLTQIANLRNIEFLDLGSNYLEAPD
ncbi:hypothetical protein CASFOL_035493 [Castilleja foliolosa]|uniref:Leucine-rich repeat-containing N-terminal plant-type domain-containing protein n=1 Tax=Castilleja foliolosa TaxID=1961234 RepID=A0ABD3BU08_9LAMI